MDNFNRFYGMHPYGHDSSIVCIDFGKRSVFAISLERLTRVKHDSRFAGALFKEFNLPVENSHICFPLRELNSSRFTYFEFSFFYSRLLQIWKSLKHKREYKEFRSLLYRPIQILKGICFFLFSPWMLGADNLSKFENEFKKRIGTSRIKLSFFDHHTSHAASAYYLAPPIFSDKTLVITLDGQGDGSFSKIFLGSDGKLSEKASSKSDFSVNLLYSLVTGYLGFNPNADEGKLEALASYSNDTREQNRLYGKLMSAFTIDDYLQIKIKANDSFPFEKIRGKSREILEWLSVNFNDEKKEDIAYGLQTFYEDFILEYILKARSVFSFPYLAVAGGGFANVKLNRRIFEADQFKEIFVCPAMGDDGAALGALILGLHESGADLQWIRNLEMPFFGPQYSNKEVEIALKETEHPVIYEELGSEYFSLLAMDLSQGLICAHYQGQMEFGPRALGNRSILANPLLESVKDDLNLKFKKREWFQPFCPSILTEERQRLFVTSYDNKHMTCAFTLKPEFRDCLPGITHVDGTARAQFVSSNSNEKLFQVLNEFKKLTGFGVLLNTSFNIHGKAIVLTPQDALDDFMSCSIDVLYIENFRVTRQANTQRQNS